MFTGIVTATFPIVALTRKPGLTSFAVAFDDAHRRDLQIGASVSLDGVCMTVTRIDGSQVHFDAAAETLGRTTFDGLALDRVLNVERSAKAGAEIGGHPLSGHVDGLAEVLAVERPENNCVITFRIPPAYARYVFNKGFIALNGCSLTVCDFDRAGGTFRVYLIPETLRLTTFAGLRAGDRANFEIDRNTQVLVDTIYAAVQGALDAGVGRS